MKLKLKPLLAAVGAMLAALLLVFFILARPKRLQPPPSSQRGIELEDAARQDAAEHRGRLLSLERELARIREQRRALEELLRELARTAPLLLASLLMAASLTGASIAYAADPPSPSVEAHEAWPVYGPHGKLMANGSTCFSLQETAALRGAYYAVPRLRLEVNTLRDDRALAQREIALLEAMLSDTRERYESERLRAIQWAELEEDLRAHVSQLERVIVRNQRKDRLRRAGVVVSVLAGGALIGWALARP